MTPSPVSGTATGNGVHPHPGPKGRRCYAVRFGLISGFHRRIVLLSGEAAAEDLHLDNQSLRFEARDQICGWGRLLHTADRGWFDPLRERYP